MTILFAGGELDGLVPSESSVTESTNVGTSGAFIGRYNTTYARCAIYVPPGAYVETPTWAQATTFWFHGEFIGSAYPSSATLVRFYDGSTEVFRLRVSGSSSSGTFQAYYLSATATFTAIGDPFNAAPSSRNTYDIKLVPATGRVEVYIAGTLRASGTVGEMTAFTGVTKVQCSSASASGAYWSQIICSTTSTIGRVVSTKPATGNGANTAWVGAFGDIDEAVYSDADGISSGTANQVETFTGASPTVNGFKVEAVVVGARAKTGESGPQNLQLAIRTSATNYFSSSSALTLGFTGNCGIWEQNPNTTADWVTATAQAVEFGVKSIA